MIVPKIKRSSISKSIYNHIIRKIGQIHSLILQLIQLVHSKTVKPFSMTKGNSTKVMGVDLIKLLKKFKKYIPAIHDLKLQTESNLHQYLVELGCQVNKHNKCILLRMPTPSPNIWVKIVVYPLSFQVDVACSQEPFECNNEGMQRLTALLENVRQYLLNKADNEIQIPEIGSWRLDHYHLNIDGNDLTYSGEKFNITYESAVGEFKRLYTKKMFNGKEILRLEQILTPRQPLAEEIQRIKQEIKII
ncbi:MAG TPA: hypothetical protein VFG24_00560 [Nitrosopumilaceae archaeon]|nr:hypothetical protein [Nitrosopumilaceae archaeon]